jgi:ABC-type sugar transport system substrate-binding protein
MKRGQSNTVQLLIVLAALPLASCEKSLHEETEHYYFVAANISLPYWQEAQAGFMDAARQMGVKAEVVGPTSYAPNEELDAFQKALEKHPAGILISPARPEIFKDAIDSAVKAGVPVVCADSDAPESKRILFIGTDNVRAGSEGARRLVQLLHNQGNVVVISVPGQLNVDQRLQGAKSVLADMSFAHRDDRSSEPPVHALNIGGDAVETDAPLRQIDQVRRIVEFTPGFASRKACSRRDPARVAAQNLQHRYR